MWHFERKEVRDKAVAWCVEHKVEIDPLGIVIALDALGLLNDPAVEHSVRRTCAKCRSTSLPIVDMAGNKTCAECGAGN